MLPGAYYVQIWALPLIQDNRYPILAVFNEDASERALFIPSLISERAQNKDAPYALLIYLL